MTADTQAQVRQLLRRLRCVFTLTHMDPAVVLVAQRLYVCKKCGKVLP